MGLDDAGYRQRFRDSAEDKVKGGLLLMALVEKENITAGDDDLAERFEKISGGNPDMLGRIKEYYASNKDARSSLVSEIKEDKAIRFLLDHAVVTELDADAIKAQ
jgi:trigger factor